uniref:Uncharacterized protein n=1 Tax=Anguilla anguilla TaxID=7936 RepID=A0A0E9WUH7_ANGAN
MFLRMQTYIHTYIHTHAYTYILYTHTHTEMGVQVCRDKFQTFSQLLSCLLETS